MASGAIQRDERWDLFSLLERVEGDADLANEMVHLFVNEAPILLAAMREALLQGDMNVIDRSAHSMKGAASNLSAQVIAVAASRLEKDAKNEDMESSNMSLRKLEEAVAFLLPVLVDFCQGVSK